MGWPRPGLAMVSLGSGCSCCSCLVNWGQRLPQFGAIGPGSPQPLVFVSKTGGDGEASSGGRGDCERQPGCSSGPFFPLFSPTGSTLTPPFCTFQRFSPSHARPSPPFSDKLSRSLALLLLGGLLFPSLAASPFVPSFFLSFHFSLSQSPLSLLPLFSVLFPLSPSVLLSYSILSSIQPKHIATLYFRIFASHSHTFILTTSPFSIPSLFSPTNTHHTTSNMPEDAPYDPYIPSGEAAPAQGAGGSRTQALQAVSFFYLRFICIL